MPRHHLLEIKQHRGRLHRRWSRAQSFASCPLSSSSAPHIIHGTRRQKSTRLKERQPVSPSPAERKPNAERGTRNAERPCHWVSTAQLCRRRATVFPLEKVEVSPCSPARVRSSSRLDAEVFRRRHHVPGVSPSKPRSPGQRSKAHLDGRGHCCPGKPLRVITASCTEAYAAFMVDSRRLRPFLHNSTLFTLYELTVRTCQFGLPLL